MTDFDGISKRLRELFDKKQGKTQAALARHCGVSTAAVAQWIKGGGMSFENIMKASTFFDVSDSWLETGIGDKHPHVRTFCPNEEIPPEGVIAISEYRLEFSAGNGSEPEFVQVSESKPAWYRVDFFRSRGINPENCKRVRVSGDSMEPYIFNGDIVLFYEFKETSADSVKIIDGQIYLISIDGMLKIKRLSKIKNGIMVSSDNAKYPQESYSGDECSTIRIYGRVIEITRSL